MKYNLSALACGLLLAVGLSLAATAQPIPDADSDGVPDSQDNCMLQQNAPQGDTDLDGYGNACDGDFDNDGIVFGTDFNLFMQNSNTSAPTYDEQYDLDCDDIVFGTDFNLFKQLFNGPPGPSGLACAGTPPCPATAHPCPEIVCDDAIDDDADGDIDCADHGDCDGQPGGLGGELCAASETGFCNDGFDNDADGLTDGNDPDCQAAQEICDNGFDDDSDGLVDCADHTDCNGQPGGPGGELCAQTETGFCADGFDNDGDGFIDGADTDCQGQVEICNNGADDEADGLTDCEDHADCDGQLGGPMGQLCAGNEVGRCSDNFDNDADGFTDGADTDCQAGAEICDDGIDNDADGGIDCADADCAAAPACSAGNRLTVRRVVSTVLGIGPDDGLWNATAATSYSMTWRDDINDTCPPDSNCSGQPPTLSVKAIHDGGDIAFRMEWNDISASSEVFEPKDFGDRAVIMLNANRICQMGSPTNPTNMWFWNAADKTQGPYGSVQNLLGGGIGNTTHTSGDDNIQVVSNHTGNEWQVVMSRPLAAVDPGDQFEFALGITTEVAFALYDGAYKQRNGAKWISGRESIDIAP
jgi:DMSO reductase family type II enzyme heme b subunit